MNTREKRTKCFSCSQDIRATLPHSVEAEMGLLGSMLINPAHTCPMVERLPRDAWYQPAHLTIVTILLAAFRDNHPMDVITLRDALRDSGELEAVGGSAYLSELYTFIPTAANASYYLGIIQKQAALRAIHLTAASVAEAALNKEEPPEILSEQLQQLLIGLAREASTGSHVATMDILISDAVTRMEERNTDKGKLRGIPSGLGSLDRLTGGWQPGQMIVVAAREKEGKSSLARQFVLEAAVSHGIPVALFSHEMSRDEITDALI